MEYRLRLILVLLFILFSNVVHSYCSNSRANTIYGHYETLVEYEGQLPLTEGDALEFQRIQSELLPTPEFKEFLSHETNQENRENNQDIFERYSSSDRPNIGLLRLFYFYVAEVLGDQALQNRLRPILNSVMNYPSFQTVNAAKSFIERRYRNNGDCRENEEEITEITYSNQCDYREINFWDQNPRLYDLTNTVREIQHTFNTASLSNGRNLAQETRAFCQSTEIIEYLQQNDEDFEETRQSICNEEQRTRTITLNFQEAQQEQMDDYLRSTRGTFEGTMQHFAMGGGLGQIGGIVGSYFNGWRGDRRNNALQCVRDVQDYEIVPENYSCIPNMNSLISGNLNSFFTANPGVPTSPNFLNMFNQYDYTPTVDFDSCTRRFPSISPICFRSFGSGYNSNYLGF